MNVNIKLNQGAIFADLNVWLVLLKVKGRCFCNESDIYLLSEGLFKLANDGFNAI